MKSSDLPVRKGHGQLVLTGEVDPDGNYSTHQKPSSHLDFPLAFQNRNDEETPANPSHHEGSLGLFLSFLTCVGLAVSFCIYHKIKLLGT